MWESLARFVLKFRWVLSTIILVITCFMAYMASQIEMTYDFPKIIPPDQAEYIEYEKFKQQYGEDGNLFVIGVETDKFFDLEFFNDWKQLGEEMQAASSVKAVLSIPNAVAIEKDTSKKNFKPLAIFDTEIKSQEQLNKLKADFKELPFYEGILYNSETNATFMALTIDEKVLDGAARIEQVQQLMAKTEWLSKKHKVDLKFSGLPYIRTYKVIKTSKEIISFLLISALLIAIVLSLLFRSIYPVIFPLIVVGIGVIWSLGTIVLLGYKITILTGLIPSLMVVIGIPNCVYFINKYQNNYKKSGDKIASLTKSLASIGQITFFANLTTAIGFGVFAFMESNLLYSFGQVAGLNIAATYFISMVLIPTIFSVLPPPQEKHLKHLEYNFLDGFLERIIGLTKDSSAIIWVVLLIVIFAIPGLLKLEAQGFLFDDVPANAKPSKDLRWFEQQFGGVMPVEIIVDTKKKTGAIKSKNLKRVDKLQNILAEDSIFSKPLSLVEGLKFANQAFFSGKRKFYDLPGSQERNFVLQYLKNSGGEGEQVQVLDRLTDSLQQTIRLSTQMADIGSKAFPEIKDSLSKKIDKIFDPEKYDVTITGTSSIAYAGYNYLIQSLISSVSFAFLLIAFIIGYLFRSVRMLLIALLPNFIPLLITASIMGWSDIFLKPSTVLIFSIAFGISVDFTIHFLAKLRQEAEGGLSTEAAIHATIRETGFSMVYTAIILFCGFIVFAFSEFQGTFYLGILTSVTLGVSLFTNLILLPAVILWWRGNSEKV